MSPSGSRQPTARRRPPGTVRPGRHKPRPAPGRRGRHGVAPLLWAAALVGLLGIVAVVVARPGSDRAGSQRRETGAVTVGGAKLPPLPSAGSADPAVGRRAPTLSGTDFHGRPVATVADGRPQVLIFLAHWCPHCRAEVPRITAWLRDQGQPAGVSLTSVSTAVDGARPNYPPSQWLGREGWPLPVLADDGAGSAAGAYGVTGFPFFVFVDGDGTVAGRSSGEVPIEELRSQVAALSPAAPASGAAAPVVEVRMGEMWFRPATVQVPAGRPVRLAFHDVGRVAHQALVGSQAEQDAAEARGGAGGPPGRTVTVDPGGTGTLVVTVPRGTRLVLGCHLPGHWAAGMRGTVVAR